ncbi:hypothetical protein ACFVH0_00080 [Streptomyces sp. NPDC127117]|uniref:hypothetical protein n=1 Tax=Streptomyces sp. NPDC127117 TaxID=3345368 RepID=UPI00362E0AF2
MVTPADTTDRNAAKEVLFRLRLMHPGITIVWADSAYAGQLVTWAKAYLNLTIKTVSRAEERFRICRSAPALGRRTLTRLGHARPPTRARLRTPRPALGITHHLGRDQAHDQAHHPPKLPQERSAGLSRSPPGPTRRRSRSPPPPRSLPTPRAWAESSHHGPALPKLRRSDKQLSVADLGCACQRFGSSGSVGGRAR